MLNFSEIIQLKQELADRTGADLHYHDVCPKPFFTLEHTNSEIREYITDYLRKKRYAPQFSEDGLQFTVERGF